jgi:hypothetical protein
MKIQGSLIEIVIHLCLSNILGYGLMHFIIGDEALVKDHFFEVIIMLPKNPRQRHNHWSKLSCLNMMQTFGMKSLIRTDRAKLNYSQYIERD